MIYLSGVSNYKVVDKLVANHIGLMAQPATGYVPMLPRFDYFACDNGCYSQGEKFDVIKFLAWLAIVQPHQSKCLFAVAPDVMCDAKATWERSKRVLPIIRAMGYKAALVAQNGIESMVVEWGAFDCLFVGGDDAFKLGAVSMDVCREAKAQGKWLHMGRVNSRRRLMLAKANGFDSCDGTFLRWPDTNLQRLISMTTEARIQARFTA